MIFVTDAIRLDESEIRMEFVRASGPGGQNVNKVSTAVQLRFNVRESRSLPPDVRDRLLRMAGPRITLDGGLLIDARQYRSQERNREDAIARLVAIIRQATVKPKPRRKTRPGKAAAKRRLDSKVRHGRTKSLRRAIPRSDE